MIDRGASPDLLIAQITDTHIVDDPDHGNLARLDAVLGHLSAMTPRPNMLLVTGDLAEHGDEASYRLLRDRLVACGIPFYAMLGNHDRRAAFNAAFAEVPTAGGFVQYPIDAAELRILMLDTLEEGRHAGSFCADRAAWLDARLAEVPDRPTVLVLHHPPVESGIAWIPTAPGSPWIARIEAILDRHPQVVALLSGHLHRPIASMVRGRVVVVCPSAAPPLVLNLMPIDAEQPDDRSLVTDGPPGLALHLWRNGRLITHFEYVAGYRPIARFDASTQPMIRQMANEAP